MSIVFGGLRRSGNFLRKNAHTLNVSAHAFQALFLLRLRLLPVRRLLRKSRSPGLPLLLLSSLQEGRLRGGSLGVHLVLRPMRLPLLPLDLGPARGVKVSLVARLLRASSPLSLQLLREMQGEVARSQRTPPAHAASSVASPRSSQHALRRDESGDSSEVRSRSRPSRVSRSSDQGTRKDRRARSQSDSSHDRGRHSHSRSAYRSQLSSRCPPASGRGLRTAPGRVAFILALGETGLDTGLAKIAYDVTGRCLLTATDRVDSVRDPMVAREVVVTVRSHAIPRAALVTARDQRREDGEPDVRYRRVWRL